MITDGELLLDAFDHANLMWDRCQRLVYTEGAVNEANEATITYPAGATYHCGVNLSASREVWLDKLTVVQSDGLMRLPVDAVVDKRDRWQILSVGGRSLAAPLVFEAAGDPRPGPSGIQIDLRKVAL
jgi:hypothetical protein